MLKSQSKSKIEKKVDGVVAVDLSSMDLWLVVDM
jgi:hypothetical protein